MQDEEAVPGEYISDEMSLLVKRGQSWIRRLRMDARSRKHFWRHEHIYGCRGEVGYLRFMGVMENLVKLCPKTTTTEIYGLPFIDTLLFFFYLVSTTILKEDILLFPLFY